MKLLRYGRPGREKPAILDDPGRLRDLSQRVPTSHEPLLLSDCLEYLGFIDPPGDELPPGNY
jgi:2,4-diketo-3-deoxy-L-fuconate hydrolase